MKVGRIEMTELEIPFRYVFKHAAAERKYTQSLWVVVHSEDGIVGYGESCPREYVTAETIHSAKNAFREIERELFDMDWDIDILKKWVAQHKTFIDNHPAAWCAIELALLDALAKTKDQTIEGVLGALEIRGDFFYTAILGDSSTDLFSQLLTKYLSMNMTDFKLKLSGDQAKDQRRIEMISEACSGNCLIRVDGNNVFRNSEQAVAYCRPFSDYIFAIEEPIKAKSYAQLLEIAKQLDVKIILDESFTVAEDFNALSSQESPWIINVRVSKLGGLLRSLDIVRFARQQHIPVIVGAHVGETSLLTRAALSVASQARDILLAQEGAFGDYFLETDVCENSLRFGMGGCIHSEMLNRSGYGLGVL